MTKKGNVQYFRQLLEYREIIVGALIMITVLILNSESRIFFNVNNLDSLQSEIAPRVLVGIGMSILFISGAFDLSVGSIMGLSGVIVSIAISRGFSIVSGLLSGFLVGLVFGIINGYLIGYLKLNHLIVTLGTMYIGRGLSIFLLTGENRFGIGGLGQNFMVIGNGKFLGIYFMVWIMLALSVIAQFVLLRFSSGRRLFYVGGNYDAAKLMGMKVNIIRLTTYIISGMLSSLAGILVVSRIGMSSRYLGEGLELKIIISCLIGGASIAGGRGSIIGMVLGVVFMSLISNSFTIFEVGDYWQNIIVGLILVLVVTLDATINVRRQRYSKLYS